MSDLGLFGEITEPDAHVCDSRCDWCRWSADNPRQAAQAAALANTDDDWKREALQWARDLPKGALVTADDLVDAIGLPDWFSSNAIGALFSSWSGKTFKAVSFAPAQRRSSHGRVLRVWEKI